MTNTEPGIRFDGPLRTDDQLRLALDDLLHRASIPQLWFIFLDDGARMTGPLMPGDGFPADPLESIETDDLGETTAAQLLAARLAMIVDAVGAASLALVWERPGPDALDTETRAWVRELGRACRAVDVPVRGHLLLHDDGMRTLVPDDYV